MMSRKQVAEYVQVLLSIYEQGEESLENIQKVLAGYIANKEAERDIVILAVYDKCREKKKMQMIPLLLELVE